MAKQTDKRDMPARPQARGLDDVIAADTALSEVDGEGGRLVIAGHLVEELAGHLSFEALTSLLLCGEPATASAEAETMRALGHARVEAHRRLPTLGAALDRAEGADALRAALAQHSAPPGWSFDHALELIAAIPVYAGA
jgi:citrate synthase